MKFLLFLGTSRDSSPPRPKRLGQRVAKACLQHFESQYFENQANDVEIELIDVLDYPLESIFKPHFAYAKGRAPSALDELAEKIQAADGYIMVSPEYNHSMSPALANLLNHFGSSLFSYKPSIILTYSAGQWGGVRAAVNMRTYLAELGCLPVSAMIHIPKAQEVFTEEGTYETNQNDVEWASYFERGFSQLSWWAEGCKAQRGRQNPNDALVRNPAQRNAPSD